MPQEQALAASFYGKFFARNLNLHLLKRSPEQWKELQSSSRANAKGTDSEQSSAPMAPSQKPQESSAVSEPKRSSRKRNVPEDDIDILFRAASGNKAKSDTIANAVVHETTGATDQDLQDVLRAIRAVPHENSHSKKRRKT